MGRIENLKALINRYIKSNQNEEITGPIMNNVLNQMVDGLNGGAVRFDENQELTTAQKEVGRNNIDAAPSSVSADVQNEAQTRAAADTSLGARIDGLKYVDYSQVQSLTDTQKEQARSNTYSASYQVVNDLTTESQTRAAADTALGVRIDNLSTRGRFLSLWDCANGYPETEPTTSPYTYQRGDYFIVSSIDDYGNNFKPIGTQFVIGEYSEESETSEVKVNDMYIYDGSEWTLLSTGARTTYFGDIAGSPYDNTSLAEVLYDINKVYIATYGTTSYNNIRIAFDEGKTVVCFYNNQIHNLTSVGVANPQTITYHYFTSVNTNNINYLRVSSDSLWVSGLERYEKSTNKVTSISSSSTDAQYPSAKCVYDAIEDSKIFIATYGTTTYDEVVAARNAGKEVIVIYTNKYYRLYNIDDTYCYFNSMFGASSNNFYLNRNGWTATSVALENTGNKVTSISSSSTDIQYPSAKCVYDEIDGVDKVFVANYGETPFQSIVDAYEVGKVVVLFRTIGGIDYTFYLIQIGTTKCSFISMAGSNVFYQIDLSSSDTWWQSGMLSVQSARLVTSIDESSDDTHYPSAKCVYDCLNEIDRVFVAVYGETTQAQIQSAIDEGKIPVVFNSTKSIWYYYSGLFQGSMYFSSMHSTNTGDLTLEVAKLSSSDAWTSPSLVVERQSNKVTSMSASSTDVQYPSAKCVYDAINALTARLDAAGI